MTLRATIMTAAFVLAAMPLAAQTSTAPPADDGAATTRTAPVAAPEAATAVATAVTTTATAEAPDAAVEVPPVPALPSLPALPPLPPMPALPPLPPLPDDVEWSVESSEQDETDEGRERLREMREASRELRAKMRELKQAYKARLKDLRKLRIDVSIDSSELATMMESVRIGLDSAGFSLRTLDSTIKFSSFGGGHAYAFSYGGDSAGYRAYARGGCHALAHNCRVRVHCDTSEEGGDVYKKMVIIRTDNGDGETEHQTVIVKKHEDADLADIADTDEDVLLDGDLRSMVIVNGDTTFLANTSGRRVVRIMTDSGNGSSRSLIISRRIHGDSSVSSYKNVLVLGGDAAKEKLKESNPELVTAKSDVVIISTSKGRKARRDRKPIDQAPSAEKPSTRTTSAVPGYGLEKAVPNPASGMVTIGYTIGQPGRTTLTLFDETGKTVKTIRDEDLSQGTYSEQVDLSDLPAGLYLYRLVSGGYSQTSTLSVVR